MLGHLAETLAGGLNCSMLNDDLLEYLLVGLNKSVGSVTVDANSILYSLIALEKFALAGKCVCVCALYTIRRNSSGLLVKWAENKSTFLIEFGRFAKHTDGSSSSDIDLITSAML